MTVHLLLAFWGVSLLFLLSPGMDWAYAIAAGTHKRCVGPAICGMTAGHSIIIICVAMGLGSFLQAIPFGMSIIALLGALYLLYMGVKQLCSSPAHVKGMATSLGSRWQWFGKGISVSLFNPKVIMIIISIFPQFIHNIPSMGYMSQISILGIIHCLGCLVIYGCVGFFSQYILSERPRPAKIVHYVSGFAMVSISFLLIGDLFLK